MDQMIYAAVRQVATSWYVIRSGQGQDHDEALSKAMAQAQFYLYDLKLDHESSKPYLEAAYAAIHQMLGMDSTQN